MSETLYRVMVLGISGNVSQGILKALRLSPVKCYIVGACVNIGTVGDLWCDEVIQAPYANEINFIYWLIEVCDKKKIDLLLTGVEENIYVISQNLGLISRRVKTKCIVSDYEKIVIGQDKLLTCDWLKENGFNYPMYAKSSDKQSLISLANKAGYPLIAKPRRGKGSCGLFKIFNSHDLEKVFELNNYVVQECVGRDESEYTVGCYCDKSGNSVYPIIMRRSLKGGATWKAEVITDKYIADECQKICARFKPTGPMNIQLRLDDNGRPIPFELNIRFSGTTPMRAHFGFRDVEAVIREYLEDCSTDGMFDIHIGKAFRYTNEAYVYGKEDVSIDTTLEANI